jgi:hypothetical protein
MQHRAAAATRWAVDTSRLMVLPLFAVDRLPLKQTREALTRHTRTIATSPDTRTRPTCTRTIGGWDMIRARLIRACTSIIHGSMDTSRADSARPCLPAAGWEP